MPAYVVSSLIIAIGILSVGIGFLFAQDMVQAAHRLHWRMVSRATVEGWDAWFLGGFSRVAMGFRWLSAIATCAGWSLIGLGCIGLGIHVLTH